MPCWPGALHGLTGGAVALVLACAPPGSGSRALAAEPPVSAAAPTIAATLTIAEAAGEQPGPVQTWSLEQLIDRAIRTNPRVLGQEAGQAGAKAGEAAARWEFFPTPQVQFEGTPGDHLVTATVTQPLYAFGRISSGMQAARGVSRAAGFRTGESRRDVALRVLDSYGQYASLSRQIAVLDSDIDRHLELEAMIHRRVEAGVSAPVDLNLVQTRLTQSRVSRTVLMARRRAALVALSELIGVELAEGAVVVPPPGDDGPYAARPHDHEAFLVDQVGSENLVQRALDRSPALQRAEAEIGVAEAQARRARSAMLPTIVARFENRTRTSGYPATGLPDTRLTIGVTLSTGAGLSSLAGVQSAEARVREASLARDAVRIDLTATVFAAQQSFNAARKSVEGLRQSRAVQAETAASYHRMFLAGKRSWLDVLSMVREQSGIERDLADAEVQLMVADVRLRIEAGDIV